MITLYRKAFDKQADRIEERLQELVLAYKTELDESTESCYIMEGETRIGWGDNMERWFLSLEQELAWSRSLSGDGCFLDPESGEPC